MPSPGNFMKQQGNRPRRVSHSLSRFCNYWGKENPHPHTESHVCFLLLGDFAVFSLVPSWGSLRDVGPSLSAIRGGQSAWLSFQWAQLHSSVSWVGTQTLPLGEQPFFCSQFVVQEGLIPPAETVTCPWPVSVSCPSHGHCNRLKDGRMKVLPRNLERDTLFLPVWLIGQCKPPVAGTLLWTSPACDWSQRKSVLGH